MLHPPPSHASGNKVKGGVHRHHCVCLSVNVSRLCLDDISWTAQPFVTKFDMFVYYHETECYEEKLFSYLEGQGHSKGWYDQNMAVSTVFRSINSPDNSPLSHSFLPVLFLPYGSFQLYISIMKVSHSPDIIPCGWLGLKHQLTN